MPISDLIIKVGELNAVLLIAVGNSELAVKTAQEAITVTEGSAAKLKEVASGAETTATAIRGSSDAAAGSTKALGEMAESSGKTAETVIGNLDKVNDAAQSTSDATQAILDTLAGDSGDILDRLLASFEGFNTDWASRVEEAIAAIRSGDLTISEFLVNFGDNVTFFEGQMRTFREIFQGADLAGIQQTVQDLLGSLENGAASMEEIFARLERVNNQAARNLLEVLKALQAGRGTAEELAAALEQARAFFPGEGDVLDDIVDDLEEIIRTDSNR